MNTLLFPKLKNIPKLLIYKKDVISNQYGIVSQYRMANTQTGEYAGEMYARKVTENMFSQYYPSLTPYDTFKIEYLATEDSNQGYGSAFIKIAKKESFRNGCQGRVTLDASRVFTPKKPPHIFYRKQGFTSIYTDRIKYIDKCIKEKRQLHWTMADNLPMYLPLNTQQQKKHSYLQFFVNKIKKILKF